MQIKILQALKKENEAIKNDFSNTSSITQFSKDTTISPP